MIDELMFNDWYTSEFLRNFPLPPRAKRTFPKESENPKDFVLVKEEWHENQIEFSIRETIDFLITITNVINSVENGIKSIEEVETWLIKNVGQFFKRDERKSFAFIAPIWLSASK